MTEELLIDKSFKVIKQLGAGYTSEVVLAEYLKSGQKIAIKIFRPKDGNDNFIKETFKHEVDIMKQLDNPYLLKILAANEKGSYYKKNGCEEITYIGVELAENAELFDFIADYREGFSNSMARTVFKQIVSGISELHENKISHRDLKTENIFLDEKFKIKIGDFGFAKFVESKDGKLTTKLGTKGYQSPELLYKNSYCGFANDIFACGVILFVMVFGHPPFKEATKTDRWYKNIYDGDFKSFWSPHIKHYESNSKEKIDEDLINLISRMLACKDRCTIKDVLESKWLQGKPISDKEYLLDMGERAKKVYERREADRLKNFKSDSQVAGHIAYRGNDNEQDLKLLAKQIEEIEIDLNELTRELPKYYLQFEGNNHINCLKEFVGFFSNKGGKIEIKNGKLHCSVNCESNIPVSEEDNTNEEENDSTVEFTVEAFINQDTNKTILDFVPNEDTQIFDFINFFKELNETMSN